MTPPPPHLSKRIAEWDPEQLFYIVKHGIKFTGMPAWPSQQRDDEVRAMVAFLLVLPTLDAEAYRQLAHGDTPMHGSSQSTLPAAIERCASCHGVDGQGRGVAAYPKLAGQRREYLEAALQAFARDERHSGIMQPIAAMLSPDEIGEVADYYSRLPLGPPATNASEPRFASDRGREIARLGIPRQRVASCIDCHGPGTQARNPHYPVLAGQYADYLVLQLELFDQRRRGGSSYAHIMYLVGRLTAEQMRDVALYYSSSANDGD